MPRLTVIARWTPGTLISAIAARIFSADDAGALRVGVGQQHDELLAAVAADEVARADGLGEDRADGGEDVVAASVPEAVVDLLEVIEVERDCAERRDRARRVRGHALDRVLSRRACWAGR